MRRRGSRIMRRRNEEEEKNEIGEDLENEEKD
jgi:hypothetical protein